jgi:hypothetical protein
MDHKRGARSHSWAWSERSVNPEEEHFELLYGSARDPDWSTGVLVARVGRAINRVFGVQFLIDRATVSPTGMIDAAVDELDFYLVNLGEPNPWSYAQYHCGTASNLYSSVHWSFHHSQRNESKSAEDERTT